MTPLWHIPLLIGAGLLAGLVGSIAGLASLASYPALLAVGLTPLTANVTNTVALVASSAGSVLGSRPEFPGQRARLIRLIGFGIGGGIIGSLILLASPSDSFELVVPWLIGLGSLAILIPRRRVDPAELPRPDARLLAAGTFLIGVYGGYFGAAAGIFMLALLLATTTDSLPRANAAKNVILGLANVVAAIVFVIFSSVNWAAAIPLAVGLFVGGRVGPIIVRRAPAGPLRLIIAIAGIGLATYLAVDAYT